MAIKISNNMEDVVGDYSDKVTIDNIESGLKKRFYKVADEIVADMMKGVRVRTSLMRHVGDNNYIITHRVTFPKKTKKPTKHIKERNA